MAYQFQDPGALVALRITVNAFSKIGDQIFIHAQPSLLRLEASNKSLSISARADFPQSTWSGPGDNRIAQVQSRALDSTLTNLQGVRVRNLRWKFRVPRRGSESLEIRFQLSSGVEKTFSLPILEPRSNDQTPHHLVYGITQTNQPQAHGHHHQGHHYTLSIPVASMRELLSHTAAPADELELRFSPAGEVVLRTYRHPATSGRRDRTRGVLNLDLSTHIQVGLGSFRQLIVCAPWNGGLRLKEFRIMLQFLQQMPRMGILNAEFRGPGCPFVCHGYNDGESGPSFSFVFLTKPLVTTHNSRPRWLRVGQPPEASNNEREEPVLEPSSNAQPSEGLDLSTDSTPHQALSAHRSTRQSSRVQNPQSVHQRSHRQFTPLASTASGLTELTGSTSTEQLFVDENVEEIGLTQGAEPSKGLFE